jgi:hypothetical protein
VRFLYEENIFECAAMNTSSIFALRIWEWDVQVSKAQSSKDIWIAIAAFMVTLFLLGFSIYELGLLVGLIGGIKKQP